MLKRIPFYCLYIYVLLTGSRGELQGQAIRQKNAAEIEQGLQKLNILLNVLYVAAHPDDENTRLITYFANKTLANTAYLSMTRGDGGQNLIGPEIREYLGIIRTEELMAARKIDGGRQFFSRASDFGYSKSADETQEIWDRDKVLSDVVWVYRNFRPDVVITRFPIDGRGGHGHHTTSAILAHEAFDLAGKSDVYKEQLQYVKTWSPKRLYLNTGRWWNTEINEYSEGVITLDVGEYNTLLGQSYSEIASVSRSQHKSQGFGATADRGEQKEFLEYRKGETAKNDLFEGIDYSWKRVKGGVKIKSLVDEVIKGFVPAEPYRSIPRLLEIRKAITALSDPWWKEIKLKEVDDLIKDCLGLYMEVTADRYAASAPTSVKLRGEVINRSPVPITLLKAMVSRNDHPTELNKLLVGNNDFFFDIEYEIKEDHEISQPYWLRNKASLGMYQVDNLLDIGKPQNDPALDVMVRIDIDGTILEYIVPVVYKWNDPVKGEQTRPFIVTPPVFINLSGKVFIFNSTKARDVEVVVKAGTDKIEGRLKLEVPEGWEVQPGGHEIKLSKKGEEQRLIFSVIAPETESEGILRGYVEVSGKEYDRGLVEIRYDHFPVQTVMPLSIARVAKINLGKLGDVVGYIQGAGDEIPASLRDIGYEVWEMNDEDITPENLARLDAVVLGIRALNTRERLPFVMDDLMKYVENGGTMIVQYNTTGRLMVSEFSPYPINLSRDRVSREGAEINILAPEHSLLNIPNKITHRDFEGWVQERGLYFPNEWDSRFTPLFSCFDPGETPKSGGLLVADYGKGHYIYTGYSWFRQLPAGVPGAFRIFANLLSASKSKEHLNKP